jgi:cobalt-zinc-cadmium efflux system membrane fusion protein
MKRALGWGVMLAALVAGVGCGQGETPNPRAAAAPSAQTPSFPPPTGVPRFETAVVTASPAPPTLTLSGKIAYGEDRYARISAPVQGRVLEVRKSLGEPVQAGEVLLILDSPDITAAYAAFARESSEMEAATRAYELAQDLYQDKSLSLKDFNQAKNDFVKEQAEYNQAKERLLMLRIPPQELEKPLAEQRITARFELKSPISGAVLERAVTPGQLVGSDPTQVLFTVADLHFLQVLADVYERDLDRVRVGQVASVTVEAYPEAQFPAAVAAIGDRVDPDTHTIKLRAWVTNEQQKLKPEMFAKLHLQATTSTPVLLIPKDAVMEAGGQSFVYVVEAPGRMVKRAVTVARSSAQQVRVLDGLTSGEQIVVKGIESVRAEVPGG